MSGEGVCPHCGYFIGSDADNRCPVCTGTSGRFAHPLSGRLAVLVALGTILGMLAMFLVQQVQWNARLEHYSRGVVALDAGNLEDAVAELNLAGGYPGAAELARRTEEKLRAAREAYSVGLRAMADGHWWDAARAFARVMAIEPRFRDASRLLERARARVGHMVLAKPYDPHLYIAHTDGMDLRQIPATQGWLSPLGLSRDGGTLLASDATGSRFYLVDTFTGHAELIFSSTVPHQVRLSPDGRAVAAFPCISTFFSLHPGKLSVVTKSGSTVSLVETGECTWAAFAPRGDLLIYGVNGSYSRERGYRAELYQYNLEEGTSSPWLSLGEWVVDMRFASVESLVLLTYREWEFRLLKVDVRTGTRQVLASSRRSFDGVLSPKGDVLVYRRSSEPGPSNYYIVDTASGRETFAFRCCGTVYQLPAFTGDGSRVLYIRPDDLGTGQSLYAVRPDGTDPVLVLEGVSQFLVAHP